MNEQIRVIVVGTGRIGAELIKKLNSLPGWKLLATVNSKGLESLDDVIPKLDTNDLRDIAYQIRHNVDVAFITIPSEAGGSAAFRYIDFFQKVGVAVVTCEKGALAYHFKSFRSRLSRIGFNATVGGGTRMLVALRDRMQFSPFGVNFHAVVNGTMNYIFTELSQGRGFGEVVSAAQRLGFAEPGNDNPLDVLNGEINDTILKATILYNTCLAGQKGEVMIPDSVKPILIDRQEIETLLFHAHDRRYIVSFGQGLLDESKTEGVIGGFRHQVGDWNIVGGFQRLDANPAFRDWVPNDAQNSILISDGPFSENGNYVLTTGPGAGPAATAQSMLIDASEILARR